MASTLLEELPDPSPGRSGWPWTEQSDPLPKTRPNGEPWPKISIVTPSYNQGQFIEETIRSVLLQGYPNLEYIVMDGGSSDETVEILEKYDPWIDHWVSEPDRGQSNAINKGLRCTDGRIWAYINSDNLYIPGAFDAVAQAALQNPDAEWVTGTGLYIQGQNLDDVVRPLKPDPECTREQAILVWKYYDTSIASAEVSNFMRRSVLDEYGYYDESLDYVMDYDLGLRLMVDDVYPYVVDQVLGKARLHEESKTVSMGPRGCFRNEQYEVIERYLSDLPPGEQQVIQKELRQAQLFSRMNMLLAEDDRSGVSRAAELLKDLSPNRLFSRPVLGCLRRLLFGF